MQIMFCGHRRMLSEAQLEIASDKQDFQLVIILQASCHSSQTWLAFFPNSSHSSTSEKTFSFTMLVQCRSYFWFCLQEKVSLSIFSIERKATCQRWFDENRPWEKFSRGRTNLVRKGIFFSIFELQSISSLSQKK